MPERYGFVQMTDLNYSGAAALLPPRLKSIAGRLGDEQQACAEELRIRTGFPLSVLLPGGEWELGSEAVSPRELDAIVEIATGASLHSSRETVRAGYINAPGGYRLGLCGTAVTDNGDVSGFRALSSIAIRIPREKPGIAESIVRAEGGTLRSTLIISPPGMGKTTLLRDLVRIVSDGDDALAVKPSRVALADERGELAAVASGRAQMNVGRRTDVLSACPKAEAVMLLLRVMNPEIIALDEITDPADVAAIERAANCGVRIFATVHAGSVDELRRKPLYEKLLETSVFETLVTISVSEGVRHYSVTRAGETG